MTKKIYLIKNIAIISTLIVALNLVHMSLQKPSIKIEKQDSVLNLNNELIALFSMGQKRFISSLLWIKTLLDSDLSHYKKRDLNSWMYLRFMTIAHLDPLFYRNYIFGGQYLGVIKDDDQGALEIYKKGINKFPNDFWLNFYLGIHYVTEIKDNKAAADVLDKVKHHPIAKTRVSYLPSLVATLRIRSGASDVAYKMLLPAYAEAVEGSYLKKKYYKTLYSIKAEKDLECLNNNLDGCSKKDFAGSPYLFLNGKWKARESWTIFNKKKAP